MAKPIWSVQPFKAIIIAAFLTKSILHIAWLAVKYQVKALQPQPVWSWGQNIMAQTARMGSQLFTIARMHYDLSDAPASAKERHVIVEVPPAHVFSYAPLNADAVQPVPQDAIWFPEPLPLSPTCLNDEKIILHFPAGAFVLALGHLRAGKQSSDILLRHLKATRMIWAQYRVSTGPETRFPAALQDAVTFYMYALSLGVDSKNIILSGDSAGGNLALALLRFIETQAAASLPLPGRVVLFSPWVSITPQAGYDYDRSDNSGSDTLSASLLQWGADAYRPQNASSLEEMYISPLHHPLKLSVPLFIIDGALEAMHSDIEMFAKEMIGIDGNQVHLHTLAHAPHDPLLTHDRFGLTEEFEGALDEAYEFLGGDERV